MKSVQQVQSEIQWNNVGFGDFQGEPAGGSSRMKKMAVFEMECKRASAVQGI